MAFNGGSAGVLRANLGIIIGTRSVEQGPITFAGINMGLILVVVHKLHWPVYWNSEEKLGKKEQYSSPLKSALGGLRTPRRAHHETPESFLPGTQALGTL